METNSPAEWQDLARRIAREAAINTALDVIVSARAIIRKGGDVLNAIAAVESATAVLQQIRQEVDSK